MKYCLYTLLLQDNFQREPSSGCRCCSSFFSLQFSSESLQCFQHIGLHECFRVLPLYILINIFLAVIAVMILQSMIPNWDWYRRSESTYRTWKSKQRVYTQIALGGLTLLHHVSGTSVLYLYMYLIYMFWCLYNCGRVHV